MQSVQSERIVRHPLHVQLYGDFPEREVFDTANGALFVQSVAALGIIEPILGLETEEDDDTGIPAGTVLVLSGWRRVLATRACGATTIPVRLVDPSALPRRGDTELVIVSANLQRQKTIDETRAEVQAWKGALSRASVRQPKAWELRSAVAKIMGVSPRAIKQADAANAALRITAARRRTETVDELIVESSWTNSPDLSGLTMVQRLRAEQQPGDLRGSDIISALAEKNEALLSSRRDEVIHASIGRASQTADGRSILDVSDVAPLWPDDSTDDSPLSSASSENGDQFTFARDGDLPNTRRTGDATPVRVNDIATPDEPLRIGNLSIYRRAPDDVRLAEGPIVDLIIAAPSWIEPLARPLPTPSGVRYDPEWRKRLQRCLIAWRAAIRPGGRLLLIIPVSTPMHPGMPVLYTAIDEMRKSGWAIGGTLVIDDPNLRGPVYAVPHPDQVMTPSGPARLILTAAPDCGDPTQNDEERWQAAWSAPLSGDRPREVAAVEEAALNHLWKYAGPGRRSQWLPDFQPGMLYHLARIFARPGATVLLPELGGPNIARGCLRAGRIVIALSENPDQITDVAEHLRKDAGSMEKVTSIDSRRAIHSVEDEDGSSDN